jgi:hypothetical protein
VSVLWYRDSHVSRRPQPAHFHAAYGDEEIVVAIPTLQVLTGSLPRRASSLELEWAVEHQADLRRAWQQATALEPIDPIEPLA